jgi:hypothetical protein
MAHMEKYEFVEKEKYLCENTFYMSTYEQFEALARYILPKEILDDFDIVGIEPKLLISQFKGKVKLTRAVP